MKIVNGFLSIFALENANTYFMAPDFKFKELIINVLLFYAEHVINNVGTGCLFINNTRYLQFGRKR